MSDRELLEKAAKAAGIDAQWDNHERGMMVLMVYYGLVAMGVGIGRRHDRFAGSAPWLADAAALALGAVLTRRAVLR